MKSVKFLSSFSHWHVKESPLKRTALKTDVIGPENILFRHVCAFSSLEDLQAGAVKGLNKQSSNEASKKEHAPLCTVLDIQY